MTKRHSTLPQKNNTIITKKVSFTVLPKAASPLKDLLTDYPKTSSPQNNLQITGEIQTDNSLSVSQRKITEPIPMTSTTTSDSLVVNTLVDLHTPTPLHCPYIRG
jgi:hypothetical protein